MGWLVSLLCLTSVLGIPVLDSPSALGVSELSSSKPRYLNFSCKGRPSVLQSSETIEQLVHKSMCPVDRVLANNPHVSSLAELAVGDEFCAPMVRGECSESGYQATQIQGDFERVDSQTLYQLEGDSISVIPRPQIIRPTNANFTLDETTFISADEDLERYAQILANMLRNPTGLPIPIILAPQTQSDTSSDEVELSKSNDPGKPFVQLVQPSESSKISLELSTSLLAESYELTVAVDGVTLRAGSEAGLFYGIQTIRQLLPPAIESSVPVSDQIWQLPTVEIQDSPTYEWRGVMLDVSRHFFTAKEVRHLIDLMAMFKMNRLHFHLTDDQGWRLEVESHPEIAEQGAWRELQDGVLYGGFFSEAEIMDIVLYGQENFVEVIPEVDMPGHSQTLLISHPEVGNNITWPVKPMDEWGVSDYTLDVSNNATYELIASILDSTLPLFPSDYFHAGGDEANPKQWQTNDAITNLMVAQNFTNYEEVQGYFEKRFAAMIAERNKTFVGWDEILLGGLPEGAVVMSWRGMNPGAQAANLGHQVVMCPMEHAYFDRKYTPTDVPGRLGVMPLVDTYEWDPRVVPGLDAGNERFIVGAQGTIWTEGMETIDQVEYLAVPRMAALSEVVWTQQESRDWFDFRLRLPAMALRMQYLNVQFPIFTPGK